jgi:hypothetical protein
MRHHEGGCSMRMTSQEINRYEVLQEAAHGGRTMEWFLGQTPPPNELRKEATEFLLKNGYLERADPQRSTPFRITERGCDLLADLSAKFRMMKNRVKV